MVRAPYRPSRPAARKPTPDRRLFSNWWADYHPIPNPQYPCRCWIRIDCDRQTLTDEVVLHIEKSALPAATQRAVHEVYGPAGIGAWWKAQVLVDDAKADVFAPVQELHLQ